MNPVLTVVLPVLLVLLVVALLGLRRRGGFAGLLLGPVSNYVIAHAACPVLVSREYQPGA